MIAQFLPLFAASIFGSSLHAANVEETAWARKTEAAKGLSSIVINTTAGELQAAADREAASVTIEKIGDDKEEACRFVVARKAGVLTVKAENRPGTRRGCKVGLRVIAPEKLELSASAGSGEVSARGFAGHVAARTGSGVIALESLRGGVEAHSGSGGIKGAGLSGNMTATTGSGDVKLAFANAPKKISVETGSGEVRVALPKGATVDWQLKTGSGEVKSAFGSTKSGMTRLSVRAGSGRIDVVEN